MLSSISMNGFGTMDKCVLYPALGQLGIKSGVHFVEHILLAAVNEKR